MSQDLLTRAGRSPDPQQLAADPGLSAFVTANAGSGKTKTLIDRVARLLLAGAKPETILCVTYTKAAASEMQRRLFDVLGGWSVMEDAELGARLEALEQRSFDAAGLSRARALFAQALETPGGLKIQTIHAFCEKLLRRFPLEAGVSPSFRVMDDAGAAVVARRARDLVARQALITDSEAFRAAYARMSVALDFQSFEKMFGEFETRRGALDAFFRREGGLDGAKGWVWRTVDVTRGSTPEEVGRRFLDDLDWSQWRRLADALSQGSDTDKKRAEKLYAVAADPERTVDAAADPFFTSKGEAATWVTSAKVLKQDAALQTIALSFQARLKIGCERAKAAQIALDTEDALTLAFAYLTAYQIEKNASGLLDFADLVDKACHLLRDRPAAAWVLYKLDGGVDHILLDEAQDTAPEQWTIIDQLTGEFFAGAGAGGEGRQRNLFVVGDEKQSIYSFQGARPEQLFQKLEFHRDRATGAGFRFERVDLLTSWRSTPQVLGFVDAVFAPTELALAVQPRATAEPVVHDAQRKDHGGCVDVWPLEIDQKADERDAWDAPLDAEPEDSATRRLAKNIAAEIKDLIARGDAVFDKEAREWRAAHAGDVLILVRRRKALFEEILRALKHAGIPVAGADRLALSEHIVFDDLVALARVILFPGDELTLAALLKSPFGGLDDDSLYRLAHGRERENLWDRLQRRADEDPAWRAAADFLLRARAEAQFRRPFELYNLLLAQVGDDGRSMRQRLLRRLGAEAEDALDEFLNQVLAAEQRGVHDLEGLAAELAGLNIVVKREMEGERREVRVMTAHGAKGLEAPIVFLPETTVPPPTRGANLLTVKDGFLWCGSSTKDCELTGAARAERARREEAEAYRLLYVALTRARDRLVLCGRISHRTDPDKLKGWWGAIRDALCHADICDDVRQVRSVGIEFQRYGPDPLRRPPETAIARSPESLPAWSHLAPPVEAFARYASPSDLGQGAVAPAPSPLAEVEGLGRFRRGDLIHRLLQLLPDIAPGGREAAADALLARERDLTAAQRAEIAAAALGVLSDARFAEVFGPNSRAEVAIAGSSSQLPPGLKISGRIDRLVVLPDRVLVADFKSNRPSPDRIEDADSAYLRQMAIYAAVLAEVFPGRRIEAALVWTDGPKLMPVPENLMAQVLADLRRES